MNLPLWSIASMNILKHWLGTEHQANLVKKLIETIVMQTSNTGLGVVRPYFWPDNTNWIALAHSMLTGLHEAVSQKFKHDMTWNRTVNTD